MAHNPTRLEPNVRKHRQCQIAELSWVFALFLGMCHLAGCEQQGVEGKLAPSHSVSHPEADLDWAMQRLERALNLHQASAEVGLRIKRDMSFEYQAPDSSGPVPRAVVHVNTHTMLLHDSLAAPKTTARSKADDDPDRDLIEHDLFGSDPLAKTSDAILENFTNVDPDDPVVKKLLLHEPTADVHVPPRRLQELRTFDLVYKQGKWQLDKEPESELERSWFKYALEN